MTPATHDTLGAAIKARRLELGMSAEGLAFKAGVSFKTIERIESDRTTPRRATLKVITDVLGLDPDGLPGVEAAA